MVATEGGGLANGGGKTKGGGTDEGVSTFDIPVGGGGNSVCAAGLWFGNTLTNGLFGIGLNIDAVSVGLLSNGECPIWKVLSCCCGGEVSDLFVWSKNKIGLNGDAFLLSGCLVSLNLGTSLISVDGVLLCCIGWKWFVDGGKTVNGWKLDALKLNASLIRLLVFCACLSINIKIIN